MGLFQGKKKPQQQAVDPPLDESSDGMQSFFDNYFSDLKDRGRIQFESIVDERVSSFKKDVDSSLFKINAELKEHVTSQIDAQLAENFSALKNAQESALLAINESTNKLQQEHQKLSDTLQKNVSQQEAELASSFDENKVQLEEMKNAQAAALQWLNQTAEALQSQYQQINQTLQQGVAQQQELLVKGFEQNMAQIVERYLLQALGEQFDVKAQLPSILKQLEHNKQDIVDDIKL